MQSEFNVQYGPLNPKGPPEASSTKVWQVINCVMAIFFILAAAANLNDDDWYLWVPIYILPGLLSLVAVLKPSLVNSSVWSTVCVVHFTLCVAYALYQVVLLIEVLEGVKNPLRHEEGRELTGLLIIITWLGISRFTNIGRPGINVTNKTLMNALLLMAITLAVLPLITWSLCFVGDWHKKLGHCKDMFV